MRANGLTRASNEGVIRKVWEGVGRTVHTWCRPSPLPAVPTCRGRRTPSSPLTFPTFPRATQACTSRGVGGERGRNGVPRGFVPAKATQGHVVDRNTVHTLPLLAPATPACDRGPRAIVNPKHHVSMVAAGMYWNVVYPLGLGSRQQEKKKRLSKFAAGGRQWRNNPHTRATGTHAPPAGWTRGKRKIRTACDCQERAKRGKRPESLVPSVLPARPVSYGERRRPGSSAGPL